jgi:hypothetical protein
MQIYDLEVTDQKDESESKNKESAPKMVKGTGKDSLGKFSLNGVVIRDSFAIKKVYLDGIKCPGCKKQLSKLDYEG